MMRKFLFLLFLLPIVLPAKLRFERTESRLELYVPNQIKPAIAFFLDDNFIVAGKANTKVEEKLGSLKVKESLNEKFHFDQIVKIAFNSSDELAIECRLIGNRNENYNVLLLAKERIDGALSLSFKLESEISDRIIIQYEQNSKAHVFGLGEQYSHLNFQGKKVPMLAEENGIGRGDPKISKFTKLAGVSGNEFSTYCPIPFYLGNEEKAIYLRKGQAWYFDFQENNKVELYVLGKELEIVVWQSKDPLRLISFFSLENGRFRVLPEWAFGTWLGIQGGPKRVDSILNIIQKTGNPVSAIWIQDWVGKRQTKFGSRLQWHWQANESAYPELKKQIIEWRGKGVRTLGYVNPFLAKESAWTETLNRYLVKDAQGEAISIAAGGFDAFQFELNDPDCREMISQLIRKELIDLGFSGWMADFAEWYPEKASYLEGNFFSRHNDYPILWQKCNRMAVQSVQDSSDFVFFSRSGYRGAGQYASTYWTGDQMTSWGENDGLPSVVNALLSSGMSGIAINHSDIGGYTNVHNSILKIDRSTELLQRWMELAAFTPIFRTHEGLMPKTNAQAWTNSRNQAFFALMGKIHFALKPYFLELNLEANRNGWPMIRHLWLHYPDETETLNLRNQFMLGSQMLVIPVLAQGQKTVRAYFPKGTWLHLLKNETIESNGEWRMVNTPLACPAAYVRNTESGLSIRNQIPAECRYIGLD